MPDWKPEIVRRLAPLKLSPTREAEIAEELAQHLEDRYQELLAASHSADSAFRVALDELKGDDFLARNLRRVERDLYREPIAPGKDSSNFFSGTRQDIRYGLRMLRKSPGFTAVAVLTLALGIGANTAIFSVINGVLLQPLEYTNPGQLVALQLFVPKLARKFPMVPLNPAAYLAWSQQAKSLAAIGVVDEGYTLNLTGAGAPALLSADAITPGLFDVLGVQPRLGRNFLPDADQPGHNHEVLLTNSLWRNRFHAEPGIIGRAIALNGSPYTVVGVLPSGFHFPRADQLVTISASTPEADLFVPAVFSKDELAVDAGFGLGAIARLKPGVSRNQAIAELNVILSQRFRSQTFMPNPKTVMTPLREMIVGSSKRGLWLLFAAVLAVLLIICVNMANLVMTQATAREHEAAIRCALGASRSRLLRQTLVETLLLGLLGGAFGLVFAYWALRVLLAVAPAGLPRMHNVRLDGAVLGFTLVISVLAGVLAGLLPAWRMAQSRPHDALRSGSARAGDAGKGLHARELLLGAGTALSTILLIAAGLLLASFAKLENVPKGFAVEHILTVNLQLPAAQYTQRQQQSEFWRNVLAATAELPGVESSAVTNWLPLGGEWNDDPVNVPGDTRPIAERPFASYRRVSPEFFKVLGIPLLGGRELTWADAGTPAVMISSAAAKTAWPGVDPIGQRFDEEPSGGFRVVGIAGDTRSVSLFKAATPMVYELYDGGLTGSLILRTPLRATAVAPELRRAIWKIDPSVAIPRIGSMGQIVSASLAPQRFETLLISLFATVALLLACLGIYGVVSYSVTRRTHEIGVRIALGARTSDVCRMVLVEGLRPVALGLVVGIAGALAVGRLVAALLFEVRPYDPLIMSTVAGALILTAALACALPARRAMRIDPMEAVRYE